MTHEQNPAALAGAGRDYADGSGDRGHLIHFAVERRDRRERERLVAIHDGRVVGHTRLRGGRWHVYTEGRHDSFFGLGSAVLALRNAIIAKGGRS